MIGVSIGIISIFTILLFEKWFFGEPDIDTKGFPLSRGKRRRK